MGCCGGGNRVHSAKSDERPPEDLEFDGPVRDRSCRDVIFLLLFAAFCGYLGYVLTTAVQKGDPYRLIRGYDDYGNVCGVENVKLPGAPGSGKNMTRNPYLIMSFITTRTGNVSHRECVEECPQPDYQTSALWRCIPREPHVTLFLRYFNVTKTFLDEMESDITLCWREIVYTGLSAFGLACALLILLRFLAGVIIWSVLLGIFFACLAGTSFMWYTWLMLKNGIVKDDGTVKIENTDSKMKGWLAGAIAGSVVSLLYFLIVVIMRTRIQLVAVLFREAGKAIGAMPLLILQPIYTFIALSAVCAGWVIGYTFILTAQDYQVDNSTDVVTFRLSQYYQGMQWYHVFALLWITQFVIACQHLIIAGAVASWFFTRNKDDLEYPISRSTYYLIRYHLGSVALGSLLIAVVKFIRALFKWLERQLNHYQSCSFMLKCCQCCLWCFEKFLVYLNRNAFIEIAIYGYSFCKGAQEALHILTNNILRVAAISSVGDFVLFLGKVGVAVATGFVGYQFVKDKEDLNYIWVPITIAVVFALLISHCFLSVYEMAIDTLFLCFCEDCQRNDGVQKPYYMSKGLMNFVAKSKRVMGPKTRRRGKKMTESS